MSIHKRTIEEQQTCPDCGADMHLNGDNEMECGNPDWCASQSHHVDENMDNQSYAGERS